MRQTTRDPVIFLLSMAGFVLFWAALAWAKADPRVLPGPWEVMVEVADEAASGALARHVGATLLRVALAFALAMSLGTALGLALGRWRRLDRWADPWVMIFLNLPALVVIVLCYLWIGLNELAAVVAVTVNKTAMVLVTVREGARTLDRAVAEMAQVYRLTPLARLRHVVLPQLAPYMAASARNGLAVIWKIVLVVEFLGRSDGVGFQIHLRFQLFDIPGVMAYALSFVAVMLVLDYGVIQPWERRAGKWRGV
ncbi:ABC transporter permease [Fertoebacter nigrum]|uniref:ABC transporter permease n=1 Tax=Fertoeibacter niger TaxID=2656921 RepID=A0A8X8GR16_9RHOB|nr:ABC transporter permease [Fertoeibacter niger]NUB42774.1 ABC transporter permease [Fertoeibacter niger]